MAMEDCVTMTAGADLSGKQYCLVRISANKTVNIASEAVNTALLGVLQNKPQSGEAASVKIAGTSKVRAGGAITAGDLITTNGSAKAATATSGQVVIGQALETAAGDESVIEMSFCSITRWAIGV